MIENASMIRSRKNSAGMVACRVVACFFVTVVLFDNRVHASGTTLMRGNLGIHDPSTVIKCKNLYYIFGTGQGTISKSSPDHEFWTGGPSVFANPPAWTSNAVPGFTGFFWAPDIIFLNNQYYLYYAVSTFGSQVSAIGLATNPTLDPTDPNYLWTDQGPVIQSTNGSAYNTIDPSIYRDASSNLWMSFGSYWNGIYMIQLDPATGKRLVSNQINYRLANNSSIEASCVFSHGSSYFLFVDWGTCCSGVFSTYNVRVGRSTAINGPYLDRNGANLLSGGGTLFLQGTGKYIGPGQVGILSEGGTNWFSYHYYDGNNNGAPTLDMEPLSWTSDNWPVFTNDWSAIYNFQADARDENGQYYGMLQGGASIQTDATRDRVLNLSGGNQFVQLPAGVGFARTFSGTVKWNGGAAWQRMFDFGQGTNSYFFLTPSAASGKLRFAITTTGNGGEQILEGPAALPTNVWTHVAVTLNGSQGILYLNGAPIATNTGMHLEPLTVVPTSNYLGRSQFPADPYFNGQIANFRVFGRALSAAEIAAPQPAIARPAPALTYHPGDTINFAGSATDFSYAPLSAAALSWSVQFVNAGVTNTVLGPLAEVTNGSFAIPATGAAASNGFYQVLLTATDASARSATNSVAIYPAAPGAGSEWSAFYPFTTDASDAGGQFNGSLVGGASIQADAQRGPVLNLSGGSQYVSLPASVGAPQTISGWVKWNGGSAWQRFFDFGVDTGHYLFFTPYDNNGKPHLGISAESSGERVLAGPNAFPINTWTHVAAVFDGRESMLYLNGSLVAVNNSVNLLPSDIGATHNYFGKSQFPDPYFNGRLDSIHLNSLPLAPEDIFAPLPVITQPVPGTFYTGGGTISLAGAGTSFADLPLGSNSFSWSVEFHHDAAIDPVVGPITGVTNTSFIVPTNGPATTNAFYRVSLTLTDTNGLQATAQADIPPLVSSISLDTAPSGLEVSFNGQPLTTPVLFGDVAGMTRTLAVASPQILGNNTYNFVAWSDGGAASHDLTVPGVAASYTAGFELPTLSLTGDGNSVTLAWPSWSVATFTLQSTTDLTPPVQWTPVTNAPLITNGAATFDLPVTNQAQFFRLAPSP